ncbi:MAG TPA: hypothetical protein VK133_00515 [Amoebophilaceae bacterium]|nr:hypothetical protein [Amoebophilaceae bacterium]
MRSFYTVCISEGTIARSCIQLPYFCLATRFMLPQAIRLTEHLNIHLFYPKQVPIRTGKEEAPQKRKGACGKEAAW